MVWHRSVAHLPRSVGAAPVPDIDGLRRAALQASWRRDRRVAQRRMALRWVVWYAIRGLPLLVIAAAVWLWILPKLHEAAQATARATAPATASATATAPAAPPPSPPELPRGEAGLQLRLESPFQPTLPPSLKQAAGRAASATDSPSPQLKPDNWLHSQEP